MQAVANCSRSLPLRAIDLNLSILLPVRTIGCSSVHVDAVESNRRLHRLLECGLLEHATRLFDEMPQRDTVSWNLMIAGYARRGLPEPALRLHGKMVAAERIPESPSTFCSLLRLCADHGLADSGLQVHCRAVSLGMVSNSFVKSALVNFYMGIECPWDAHKLFDEMPDPNVACCNSVLRGLLQMSMVAEMVGHFRCMRLGGVDVNAVSFSYLIQGCICRELFEEGRQFHSLVIRLGFARFHVFVANSLVDLYCAYGSRTDARRSLNEVRENDVISWNSVVVVHAKNGILMETVVFFRRMLQLGWRASVRSLVALLNTSSRNGSLDFGIQLHGFVLRSGQLDGSAHLRSALIDMYGKCGKIRQAVSVFDKLSEKEVGCCNSLMTSLMHCNARGDVVEMIGIMTDEGARPDNVSLSTVLKVLSASEFSSLGSCQALHCCVVKSGFETEIAVSSSLVDAYSKCRHVDFARRIFEEAPDANVVSFTALIAGYARNGEGRSCLELLERMVRREMRPNAVTLLAVLAGCGHFGLVREGRTLFGSMKEVYGVEPDQRHYSCMVGLLGRAGLVEEAMELAEEAPLRGHRRMRSSLIHFCRVYGNREHRISADTLLDSEAALLLERSHDDERRGNAVVQDSKIWRRAGRSFVEVGSVK